MVCTPIQTYTPYLLSDMISLLGLWTENFCPNPQPHQRFCRAELPSLAEHFAMMVRGVFMRIKFEELMLGDYTSLVEFDNNCDAIPNGKMGFLLAPPACTL